MVIKSIVKNVLPYGIVTERQREQHKATHINRALRSLSGSTYVEIGVERGRSFRQITAPRKIGVDPAPRDFGHNLAPGELFFEMTSDRFFADHAETLFHDQPVDVALVDGLHEFSQALRDVLNLERFMSRRGVIFVHDCNPPTREDAEVPGRGPWTGDVWKVAYYLRNYRPGLCFFTLDCDWGLGIITGFRSPSVSEPTSSNVLGACKLLDYEVLEKNRNQILRLHTAWYSRLFFGFVHPRRVGGRNGSDAESR